MSIAPFNCDRVAADQTDRKGLDLLGNRLRIESSFSGDLIDASGAGAGQAKLAGWEETLVPIVPFHKNIVDIGARNLRRDRNVFVHDLPVLKGDFDVLLQFALHILNTHLGGKFLCNLNECFGKGGLRI